VPEAFPSTLGGVVALGAGGTDEGSASLGAAWEQATEPTAKNIQQSDECVVLMSPPSASGSERLREIVVCSAVVPHAHHFLERLERVQREDLEFLLALYRDHDALKYILEHVNLPEEAARVALSVRDPKEGPFAIVTRDGKFVTCLGEGMHHGHPVVPRPQIDALLAKVADKRDRREIAERELRPEEEEDDLLQRTFIRGRRFAREDFQAVSAFEAMLGLTPFLVMVDIGADIVPTRAALAHGAFKVQVKGTTIKPLQKQDDLEWAVAHLMVLTGAAEHRSLEGLLDIAKKTKASPTYLCSAQGGLTWSLRAAWTAARLGKGVLPVYKQALTAASEWGQILDAALGLAAIGIRHSGLVDECKRTLEGYKVPETMSGELANASPPDLLQVGRAVAAQIALAGIGHIETGPDIVRNVGRDFCVVYGGSLPEGHPLRYEKPEDVPDELAKVAVLSFPYGSSDDNSLNLLASALPVAARAAPEDFYFPREVVRAWFGQWTPDEQLERLKLFAKAHPKKGPVRIESKIGRNDPCTCGSGKKWKKCHGAGAA
jgi:hypothetical protein